MAKKVVSLDKFREEKQQALDPVEAFHLRDKSQVLDPLDFAAKVLPLAKKIDDDDGGDEGGGTLRDPLEEEMLAAILYNELLEEMKAFAKMMAGEIDLANLERKQAGDLGQNLSKEHPLSREAQFSGVDKKETPIVSENEEAADKHAKELQHQYQKQLDKQLAAGNNNANTPRPM